MSSVQDMWLWWRHRGQLRAWHEMLWVYIAVWLVWGGYRLFSPLPVVVEEILVKGLVFGGVVYVVGIRQHGLSWRDLGLRVDNLFRSVYLGLGLGMVLAIVGQLANVLRHGGMMLSDQILTSDMVGGFLLLALVTAFWEGLFFYGFLLSRLILVTSEITAVSVIGLMYTLLHVPVLLMTDGLGGTEALKALLLLLTLGISNSILMLRMRNLAAPMLSQVVWGVTLFLFR